MSRMTLLQSGDLYYLGWSDGMLYLRAEKALLVKEALPGRVRELTLATKKRDPLGSLSSSRCLGFTCSSCERLRWLCVER